MMERKCAWVVKFGSHLVMSASNSRGSEDELQVMTMSIVGKNVHYDWTTLYKDREWSSGPADRSDAQQRMPAFLEPFCTSSSGKLHSVIETDAYTQPIWW